jgi:hypothetical protein
MKNKVLPVHDKILLLLQIIPISASKHHSPKLHLSWGEPYLGGKSTDGQHALFIRSRKNLIVLSVVTGLKIVTFDKNIYH